MMTHRVLVGLLVAASGCGASRLVSDAGSDGTSSDSLQADPTQAAQAELSLLSTLHFTGVTPKLRGTPQPGGTPGGPQPAFHSPGAPLVIAPGDTLSIPVIWSGGAIGSINLGVAGGSSFLSVPLPAGAAPAGAMSVAGTVDQSVCANLHAVCHALSCCMQVVTGAGKASAAAAQAMILDCTGGVGCAAIGYAPAALCPCDPSWQECQQEPRGEPCGEIGQPCCDSDRCTVGTCNGGRCDAPPDMAAGGASAGAPCKTNADCGGTKAVCVTKNANGLVFPEGYCSSACNPAKNAMDGTNPACPGDTSVCSGPGTQGTCLLGCMMAGDCHRAGYSCFNIGTRPVCEPSSLSECNPEKKGSCPQDGGVVLPSSGDGGTGSYSGRVCLQVGPDPVGQCVNGCDVFQQNCPDDAGQAQGCFAEPGFGQGTCDVPFLEAATGKDGDPCQYLNGCEPGFACHVEQGGAWCRAYCGGPKTRPCPMGRTCGDLSAMVAKSVVGVCGP